ncbi:hypothetical protein EDD36DRAFT_207550 [Exophiala viscosa]|uniref:NAD-dependent epimerase/dehydratase domain-containing protein n=1 Tax=Exophiala viscosa TaxID=2486360 RepID=A0AAN6DW61_9EURO|nr:hypothetical protein EDD36DRAFT_207550 [Exophiala viscosa]
MPPTTVMAFQQPLPQILVTGTTGPLGSAVALAVARAGFPLRGTSLSKERAAAWSAKYPEVAIEWVTIEDHEKAGTYDEAVRGCSAVVHVAGPFTRMHTKGDDIMIAQTRGTQSILDACAKETSVKRLVYTSSVAAVHDDPHLGTGQGKVYTEADWNPTSWEKGSASTGEHMLTTSYCAGKTLAEKLVWTFMEEQKPGFDTVVLCPATIYGKIPQAVTRLSDLDVANARLYAHLLHANETIPSDPHPSFTNVDDAADAYLKALTWPKLSNQRYLISSGSYSYARVFAILRKNFPKQAHRFPEIENEGLPVEPSLVTDASKAEREMGMRWTSLEETMVQTGGALFALEETDKS